MSRTRKDLAPVIGKPNVRIGEGLLVAAQIVAARNGTSLRKYLESILTEPIENAVRESFQSIFEESMLKNGQAKGH